MALAHVLHDADRLARGSESYVCQSRSDRVEVLLPVLLSPHCGVFYDRTGDLLPLSGCPWEFRLFGYVADRLVALTAAPCGWLGIFGFQALSR